MHTLGSYWISRSIIRHSTAHASAMPVHMHPLCQYGTSRSIIRYHSAVHAYAMLVRYLMIWSTFWNDSWSTGCYQHSLAQYHTVRSSIA
eukprot:3941991-Rhodomonas_salina.2